MPPLAHAALSASGAHRWLKCPGSVRLSHDAPRTTSIYAEEGTAAHTLAEWCLNQNVDAASKIGKTLLKSAVNGKWIAVTTEMAAAVQMYLDTVRAAYKALPGSSLVIEQRFKLDWLIPDTMFGTNDASVIQKYGKMVTFDLKYGQGVSVEAEENDQLRYYALGALGEKNLNCIEEMEITIVQPRGQGDKVKTWRTTPEETYTWAKDVLLPGAQAALAPDAPLCAGDWCKFCPAKTFCPALQKKAVAAFSPVSEGLPAKADIILRPPKIMEVERLEQIAELASLVKGWFDACTDELEARIKRGIHSDKFKVVAGRATRSWTDETVAADSLRKLGIDPLAEPELISVAEAEKRMKAANCKTDINTSGLVTISRGTSLVPMNDKRPALPPATAGFEVVP